MHDFGTTNNLPIYSSLGAVPPDTCFREQPLYIAPSYRNHPGS